MALKFRSLNSSHIQSAAHDRETDELHVTFKTGKTYVYEDVDADEAHEFFNATSHGKHLSENIKGVKNHRASHVKR